MHPDYKYQVIFFGDRQDLFESLKGSLLEKAEELKIGKEIFIFLVNEGVLSYKGNQPAFCVFANSSDSLDEPIRRLIRRQKEEGNAILPLYENDFNKEVNDILSEYNGKQIKDGVDSVVNHILEGFDMLRRRRRLFISYRRTDSREIAVQLFEYFESLNYDVFLDTHSVPKASHFQNQLWHDMSDSDMVILLDTNDFMDSEWCARELAFAESKRISILRLKFLNSSVKDDNAAIVSTISLNESSFDGSTLTKDKLSEVSHRFESLRARALASRQDGLITEFLETGRSHSKDIARVGQNLLLMKYSKDGSEKEYLFIPAIGVPQSMDFHNVDRSSYLKIKKAENVFLIYDDTSLLNSWNDHLMWLDAQLKIKSLCCSKFNEFFQNL